MRSLEMQINAQVEGTVILQEENIMEGVEIDEVVDELNVELGQNNDIDA